MAIKSIKTVWETEDDRKGGLLKNHGFLLFCRDLVISSENPVTDIVNNNKVTNQEETSRYDSNSILIVTITHIFEAYYMIRKSTLHFGIKNGKFKVRKEKMKVTPCLLAQ